MSDILNVPPRLETVRDRGGLKEEWIAAEDCAAPSSRGTPNCSLRSLLGRSVSLAVSRGGDGEAVLRLSALRHRLISCIALYLAFITVFTLGHAAETEDERPIEPKELTELIKQADRIVVSETARTGAKILFNSTNPSDISEFNDAVEVLPPAGDFHCMCSGTPAVRLFRGKTELVLLTNHHGRSVRCSLWASDALVKDSEKWVFWFEARKMPKPRKEVEDAKARAEQNEISRERWEKAMPKSIRLHWKRATHHQFSPDLDPLRRPLAEEFPDIRQRTLALLHWFGSGVGPWSGFPGYEAIAEKLLLDVPTPDLIAAAEAKYLTKTQLEGAARILGGWEFSQTRANYLKSLSPALKKKLLDHSLVSTDKDKVSRAKRAFAP